MSYLPPTFARNPADADAAALTAFDGMVHEIALGCDWADESIARVVRRTALALSRLGLAPPPPLPPIRAEIKD